MLDYLILLALIGIIPGVIASARGLSFLAWFLYGAILWPVAMVHVWFATPDSVTIATRTHSRTCPHCAETVKAEAKVCKHCGRDLVATTPAAKTPTRPASAMFRPYDPKAKR